MKFRRIIFWLHLSAGVGAGLVIFIMSVTGVLLMYQRQITAWADDARVTPPAAGAKPLSVEELLAKVRQVESASPSAITISSDPQMAASFSFGREKVLFANPYTGEIVGEGSKRARVFFQFMINVHRWLAFGEDNRPIGKAITGACNLAFLFLVMSGFYLWWPRQWNLAAVRAVITFDRSLSGKARDWNWHNVIGFWSAIPLFLVVFTAIFFSYPWATTLLYRAAGAEPPPRPKAPPAERKPAQVTLTGLDAAWAVAEMQLPGWKTISLRLPASPTAPLNFTIDQGNGARPDLRAQLTLAGKTGAVEKLETYSSQNTPRKIRLWVRWIHTGEAGGFLGQTIAGLASAGGAVLVWTGLSLAIRRFFKRKAASPDIPARDEPQPAHVL
jgi:uncharacterized iron-regulated membrane protein